MQLIPVVAFLEFCLLAQFYLLTVEGFYHVHALEDAHYAAAAPFVEAAHILS